VPALSALQKTAGKPNNRLSVVYVPNGVGALQAWTPTVEGAAFEFTPILKPLEPFRNRLIVLSGLNSKGWPGERTTAHARASTKFLTNMPPKSSTGSDLGAGVSMDQILARELGQHTELGSLELVSSRRNRPGPATRAIAARIRPRSPGVARDPGRRDVVAAGCQVRRGRDHASACHSRSRSSRAHEQCTTPLMAAAGFGWGPVDRRG
jgi:Protein of unknown function (DUF1552)